MWWVLGHSGALSLQGWLQKHGIDGVVMRDRDVRKQTPIQRGTSKGGLLGNSGAHHHLPSPESWGGVIGRGKNRKKKRTVQKGSHTSPNHVFIILACDLSQRPWPRPNLQFVSMQVVEINYLSILPKHKTISQQHTYACYASQEKEKENLAGFLI